MNAVIVKKQEATQKKKCATCTITEFNLPCEEVELALAKITGRYPETGWTVNEKIKEIFHVLKGKGLINVENETHDISEGDTVFIKPHQRYFFEGKLEIVLACSPKYTSEQQKVIP